jgi:hypothetical protein
MQFRTSEVRQVGENILKACSYSGTGNMLMNMADAAERKRSTVVNTDNKCVLSVMRTARQNMNACIAWYAN